jgi:hypothetical protein
MTPTIQFQGGGGGAIPTSWPTYPSDDDDDDNDGVSEECIIAISMQIQSLH